MARPLIARTCARAVVAAVLLLSSVACQRLPPPPYPRAFTLVASSPRLLVTSQETTVPLSATNTGLQGWTRAGEHLSYHWLWLVPRDSPLTRPYGDWTDGRHLSMAGEAGSLCYDETRPAVVELSACAVAEASARRARDASRLIVVEDLQQRFRTRLDPAST